MDNPFRAKAERARAEAERLSQPTAHDEAMRDMFPRGAGYGRPGASKRLEAKVNRATKAAQATREAERLETLARLYDEGKVNAQGRSVNTGTAERREKREAAQAARQEKIREAQRQVEEKGAENVDAETYATALGYLAGGARALAIYTHGQMKKGNVIAGQDK